MRKLYLLFATVTVALTSWGQANPTPQVLPYTFSTLTASALPSGMAAHRFGTASAAIPTTRTSAPGNGDLTYVATQNSGGWNFENANGISLLASGSQAAGAVVISINTTGLTTIQVSWTCRLILQQTSRDNSIALQYRIGTSGNFVDVGTTSTYNSQGKTLPDAAAFTETLPAAAENQADVQVRWIYWESNGTAGSRDRIALDDVTISGTSPGGDATPPIVTSLQPADNATGVAVNATAVINFSESVQKGAGNIYVRKASDNTTMQTFDVTTAAVTVSGAQASFKLALANSTDYYVEVDAGAFKDISGNNHVGLSGNTAWNFTTVAPPAAGILGNTYGFNICGNYINEGFQAYSFTGAQVWTCTKFGRTYTADPSADSALEMNGFASGNVANEDWLISPKFNLTGTAVPLLNFYTYNTFNGAPLSLRVSTDYSGSGDPALATWTTINGEFPDVNSNFWKLSDSINLSAFKSANTYVAWVYTSTAAAASRWRIDDVIVYNSAAAPQPSLMVYGNLLDFHRVNAGASSIAKAVSFYAADIASNLTVTAPAGFEVSKDNVSFTSSVTYTPAEAGITLKTLYVRYTPPAASSNDAGTLQFAGGGVSANAVFVKGNTQDPGTTLNVVNWNVEWFGSTGNGPTDENLQQANAKKVMDALDADVYAVAEIVDVTRFSNLISSLNQPYGFVIGEYCSGGTTTSACATNQKLALAYKTGVLSNVTARPLLISSASARTNWASGRVPFLVTANVTKNGQTASVNFIVLHAKANTGNTQDQIDSYNERKLGVRELKDTLDANFANSNIVMVGDYNDDLDRTIAPTTGPDTVSSYQPLIADSTDANSYRSLTLPLSYLRQASTTGFPDVIDHVVISNEMASRYLAFSASIYNDIEQVAAITNYATTTSDHYPVMSRFLFGGTLPVRFNSFTAVKQATSVKLQWTTSQEVNTKEFEVERSTDGVRFEKLATVSAVGNSATPLSYQTVDAQPARGINLYRLRAIDFDGKAEVSGILRIDFSKAFTVSLSPNPATGYVLANITGVQQPVTMQFVNAAGKTVRSAILSNGTNRVVTDGLAKGLYVVRFTGKNGSYTERVVVQ